MELDAVLDATVAAHPLADADKAQQILADVMTRDDAPAARQPGELDRKGNPFDPGKHDGTLTARGTWRKLTKASRTNVRSEFPGASPQSCPPDQSTLAGVPEIDTRAVAESWLDIFFTL